jgi:hemoglobin
MRTISQVAAAFLSLLLLTASPIGVAQTAPDTVYQGLGGKDGIRKIVNTFLLIVVEDARIRSTFNDADRKNLADKLVEQFCELSGGPCKYSGKDMKTIHEDLKITHAQFNALAEDLQTAMDRHGIPSRVQNKLIAKLAPMHRDVVTR